MDIGHAVVGRKDFDYEEVRRAREISTLQFLAKGDNIRSRLPGRVDMEVYFGSRKVAFRLQDIRYNLLQDAV